MISGASSPQYLGGAWAPARWRAQSPQQGPGAGPLIRRAKPPEALLFFERSMEAANLTAFLKFGKAKNQRFVLSSQKNHVCPRNGGSWSKTGGTTPPSRA